MRELPARIRFIRSQLLLIRIYTALLILATLLLASEIAGVFFHTGPLWWWTHA